MKKGDYIQMDASLAGLDFSYSPGQVLEVGRDIDAAFAQALVTTDPGEEARAHTLSRDDGKRIQAEQLSNVEVSNVNEVPRRSEKRAEPEPAEEPKAEPEVDDDPDQDEGDEEDTVEERSEQAGDEKATAPEAEKRETAVPKRERRKVKPPEKTEDETDGE